MTGEEVLKGAYAEGYIKGKFEGYDKGNAVAIYEFAKWLSRKYGMFSPIGLIDGITTYEELNANEVVEEFLEHLQEKKNEHI